MMTRPSLSLKSILLGVSLLAAVPALHAQTVPATGQVRQQVTRAELTEMLAQAEAAQQSSEYSAAFRSSAAAQANAIRQRLNGGDFRIGDQIDLSVRTLTALTDTFIVESGPQIRLPDIGAIPLAGVLRSELESHLTTQIGRFVRSPEVEAKTLFRITISGSIARQGYHTVSAEEPIADAIMNAGGVTPGANLDGMQVLRGDIVLMEGAPLQDAIAAGSTFDELNLAGGDRLLIPQAGEGTFNSVRTFIITISTVVAAVGAIIAIF